MLANLRAIYGTGIAGTVSGLYISKRTAPIVARCSASDSEIIAAGGPTVPASRRPVAAGRTQKP